MFQKYIDYKNIFITGDLVLFRGKSLLAKIIQKSDNAYYNHIGIVIDIEDKPYILDMWVNGIELTTLDERMQSYKDFCILRPKYYDKKYLYDVLGKYDNDVNYEYFRLLRILIKKKLGIDLKFINKGDRYICSELVQEYANNLSSGLYKNFELISPMDYLRVDYTKYFNLLLDNRT